MGLEYNDLDHMLGNEWTGALPPVCPECGYNLTGCVSGRCPECGRGISRQELRRLASETRMELATLRQAREWVRAAWMVSTGGLVLAFVGWLTERAGWCASVLIDVLAFLGAVIGFLLAVNVFRFTRLQPAVRGSIEQKPTFMPAFIAMAISLLAGFIVLML